MSQEEREIVARVLEVAVLVTMGTYVYSFCEKLFIQRSGGPIGMRSTASLANVIMKYFDGAWMKMMNLQGVIVDSYSRYVDDCRLVLASLNKGWRWTENGFKYSKTLETKDHLSGMTTNRGRQQNSRNQCVFSWNI